MITSWESESLPADVMYVPGAKAKTQDPMFENGEIESSLWLEATVKASGHEPGE